MTNVNPSPSIAIIKAGLRSIATAIPGLSSLGQAWNEYDSFRTGQRIEELLKNMQGEFDDLRDRNCLNEKQIDAIRDEVPSLIEVAVEKVRREFRHEKRRLYARLLVRLINGDTTIPYDEKVSWLHEFDVISPADLKILQSFPANYGRRVAELPNSAFSGFPLAQSDDKCGEFVASLSKLEARGLIGETTTSRSMDMSESFGDPASWTNKWGNRVLGLLPAGRRLRDLLGG